MLTAPPVLTVRGCEVMAELYRTLPAAFDDFCSSGVSLYQGKYDNTDGYADFSRSAGKWPVILQMLRIDVPENGRHGPCPKCGGRIASASMTSTGAGRGFAASAAMVMVWIWLSS